MLEATGPHLDPIARDAHLLQPVIDWAQREPERPVAAYRDGDHFVDVGAADLYRRIRSLAKGMIAAGIQPGDRVALMSRSRLEWTLTDDAVLAAGGVTVPIYETSSAEQIEWIVRDSGAVMLIVETPDMRALYDEVAAGLPDCRTVWVIDEGGLERLADGGTGVADAELDDRIHGLTTDRLATILYTSGTTGRPKGCTLTHANLRTNVMQVMDAVQPMFEPDEVVLLFLPLAHSLAKIIALVGTEWGMKAVYATDLAHLPEELVMAQPTMVTAVPRVFEKVYNAAQHKTHAEGKLEGALFDHAVEVASQWSRNRTTHHLGPVTTIEHAGLDPIVYRKLRAAFGGRLRFAFSGGGPLGERLTHFFNGVGVKIFEGYGLTETSPVLAVNRADAWHPGTVGRPVAATTIRIAEDGEILAKGPQVFDGYWNDPVRTAECFDEDGWFCTGDIGELDEEGFVRITGRKKDLIVTAGGINAAPAPLEDRLRAHPLISQAVVIGDGRPFIAALLTADEEAATEWAADRGVGGALEEILAMPDLRAELQAAVDDANRSVSRAESIREFAILPHDLTIAAGELTPTLKVRRSIVEKSYGAVIDALYAGTEERLAG